jgi:hypothetical protein
LKHKVDDTIKEPESASRIGVVIKWHVLELSILRHLPTSANPQAVVLNSRASPQSRGSKRMQGPGIMLAIRGYCILKCGSKIKSECVRL